MADRYTADLANDLGNLVNRVLNMVGSYCDARVPEPAGAPGEPETRLAEDLATATSGLQAFDRMDFKAGLAGLWTYVSGVNRYVEARAPWAQRRSGDTDGLHRTLYTCVDALRIIAVLISPVMPDAAEVLWAKLGLDGDLWDQRLPQAARPDQLPAGTVTHRGDLLFPRLEDA
jgi:methionyl-tRNA synthetase